MNIKHLPDCDKPREKLIAKGAQHLSESELLAILINTGRKGRSSVEVAQDLLNLTTKLKDLKLLSLNDLMDVKGIGMYKAVILKAAFELGERMNAPDQKEKVKINSPQDAADYFLSRMMHLTHEQFEVLFLNSKNIVIRHEVIFVGTLNSSVVHPREVFKAAIKWSSNAIIVVHNHPSGDVTPSKEDIHKTKRLQECGRVLGIELLDHIIIGDAKYLSLVEAGYFDD
ncbi:RadC family protein [Staphylococcus simulans]|nr:DNA repair protein RadC [Staphylococcus simulans]RIN45069.1 JAB domain-containing protein [Staphylococcus simulans]RIN72302.1 JAB domain-containing protein [Staphylococcus simulans]